jgi:hypothetical protein
MILRMKHEPRIADQTDSDAVVRSHRLPDAHDIARAKASYARGGRVEHLVVGQWLLTWGKPGRKPFGEWLQDQDG